MYTSSPPIGEVLEFPLERVKGSGGGATGLFINSRRNLLPHRPDQEWGMLLKKLGARECPEHRQQLLHGFYEAPLHHHRSPEDLR